MYHKGFLCDTSAAHYVHGFLVFLIKGFYVIHVLHTLCFVFFGVSHKRVLCDNCALLFGGDGVLCFLIKYHVN